MGVALGLSVVESLGRPVGDAVGMRVVGQVGKSVWCKILVGDAVVGLSDGAPVGDS